MAEQVREHRSLLAAAEKRLLIRMAGHMPASIHSDHLTVLALAAMALAGLGFWLAQWNSHWLWVVVAALVGGLVGAAVPDYETRPGGMLGPNRLKGRADPIGERDPRLSAVQRVLRVPTPPLELGTGIRRVA